MKLNVLDCWIFWKKRVKGANFCYLRCFPLNDYISRFHHYGRRFVVGASLIDNTSFCLRVRKPSFDDHRLWFSWQRWQTFDDNFSWWWRQSFTANCNYLFQREKINLKNLERGKSNRELITYFTSDRRWWLYI